MSKIQQLKEKLLLKKKLTQDEESKKEPGELIDNPDKNKNKINDHQKVSVEKINPTGKLTIVKDRDMTEHKEINFKIIKQDEQTKLRIKQQQEEKNKKIEEDKKNKEQQRQEEEKKKKEFDRQLQLKRQQEEVKRREEQRKEEQRKEEENNRIQEQRRQQQIKRQEDIKRKEEEQKQDEQNRLDRQKSIEERKQQFEKQEREKLRLQELEEQQKKQQLAKQEEESQKQQLIQKQQEQQQQEQLQKKEQQQSEQQEKQQQIMKVAQQSIIPMQEEVNDLKINQPKIIENLKQNEQVIELELALNSTVQQKQSEHITQEETNCVNDFKIPRQQENSKSTPIPIAKTRKSGIRGVKISQLLKNLSLLQVRKCKQQKKQFKENTKKILLFRSSLPEVEAQQNCSLRFRAVCEIFDQLL